MRKFMAVLILLALVCLLPFIALAGTSEISGHAWLDDGSGLFSEDGRMQQGIHVSLYRMEDGAETQVATTVTNRMGFYQFSDLVAGQYRLRVKLPDTFCFVIPQDGGSVFLPAAGSGSFTLPINLTDGQTVDNAHIGLSHSSTYIKVMAFEDLNQNGGRSTNEPLLSRVPVTLFYEMDGQLIEIASGSTDNNGELFFMRLTPGTYRVAATLPAPYIFGPLGAKTSLWYNCVPPSDSYYGMTDPVTVPKGDSLGIGIGAVSTGSLQGMIWNDSNMNGLQDGILETGYAGAVVQLVSEAAGVNRTATTGENGLYRFEKLLAGEYTLTVTLPENGMFTLPGGDSLFTDGYSRSASCQIVVETMVDGSMQSIGVMPATSLSVHVYNDINVNGVQDASEPPFAGASLEVLVDDVPVASALSDGAGVARVPVLRGGDMELRLTLPGGQVFTVEGADSQFTAPAATADLTIPVTVPHGQETELKAGVTQAASVSGILFDDRNLNGVMDSEEPGLSGFTMQAVNADGAVVAQTKTDGSGYYAFDNLLPAAHTVRVLLVDAYVCSDYSENGGALANRVIAQTAEYGETVSMALTPGQSLTSVCAGIFRSATISGQVLLDTGIPTLPATGGMAGVQVRLLDEYGAEVGSTTTTCTDENGDFYLKGALPGDYQLEFVLPENAAFLHPIVSDESYTTEVFNVQAADDLERSPLYAIYTGSLSGVLYIDENLNGQYDEDEAVLSGVGIQLTNTDLDQVYETLTLDNGQYILDHLRPGAYTLWMTLPEGLCYAYDASSPLAPQVELVGQTAFDIGIDEQMEQRNIAAARPASFTGTLYYDTGNNGGLDAGEPGVPGVTVSLAGVDGPQTYSIQTDENGVCRLDAIVPGVYTMRVTLPGDCIPALDNPAELTDGFWVSTVAISSGEDAQALYGILKYAAIGGHVWSLDGSLNGVVGRTVNLYLSGSAVPVATAMTDETGGFVFRKLLPGSYLLSCDLPDATYKYARAVDAPLRPVAMPGDVPDIPVGFYDFFPLAMGQELMACDIGIGAMGELGDTAWLDDNGNGLQDGGELNVPGIAVRLYQYGELVAEAVTDTTGRYLFTDLYPGLYTVEVTMPEELRVTRHREDYPLAASILAETDNLTAKADNVTVPSAGRNLNCDFGFVLREEGVYPAVMDTLASIDWSFDP